MAKKQPLHNCILGMRIGLYDLAEFAILVNKIGYCLELRRSQLIPTALTMCGVAIRPIKP